MNLILPKANIINNIFHISDIHIRNGDYNVSRYEEYKQVFDNLIIYLRENRTDDSITIITGDIFDKKTKTESYGIFLFNHLINGISQLMPIYIIAGNHDIKHKTNSNDNKFDNLNILDAFFESNKYNNVQYLNKTGCYIAGDIGFGIVIIEDSINNDKLPLFPNNFPENIKLKIALFHGTITNSLFQNYTYAQEGFPLDWFKDYDLGMFGDIHLQQLHNVKKIEENKYEYMLNNKLTWGYSSSLIQQNFGESIIKHGCLKWNLINKTVSKHFIFNEYGKICLESIDNEWYICLYKKKNNISKLKDIIKHELFPKIIDIKIKNNSSKIELDELNILFKKHNIKYNILTNLINVDKLEDNIQEQILFNDDTFINYGTINNCIDFINLNTNNEEDKKKWISYITNLELFYINENQIIMNKRMN